MRPYSDGLLGGLLFSCSGGNPVLSIELGGLAPDTEHDQLVVMNTATIAEGGCQGDDGKLELSYSGGFTASPGDSFVILTAGSVVGEFEVVVFPDGQHWQIDYGPNTITVRICTGGDCNSNGVPDGCEPDTDGDGVIDGCDQCPGFDDSADIDGDGIADGCDPCDDRFDADGDGVSDDCDLCPGGDDTIDCNGDGIPDACQLLDSVTYTNYFGSNTALLCDLVIGDSQGSFYNAPEALTDVTLTMDAWDQNIDESSESIDVYANDVLLGTLFEGIQSACPSDALTVTAADWNVIRTLNPGSEVKMLALRNAASCAGVDNGNCTIISWSFTIDYTTYADANGNGWLDECIPDCNPNDIDSDGDGVVDNCDACPDTIADPSIVTT